VFITYGHLRFQSHIQLPNKTSQIYSSWLPLMPSEAGSLKKKVKLSRYTPWGERMYSSYSFLTSALDGGEWSASASRPGRALPPGKEPRYPLDRRLGGPQSRSGRRGEKKNLPLSGIEPRSPDRPARSQTLYCLRYRGSLDLSYISKHLPSPGNDFSIKMKQNSHPRLPI
jgi:hypothetical protein